MLVSEIILVVVEVIVVIVEVVVAAAAIVVVVVLLLLVVVVEVVVAVEVVDVVMNSRSNRNICLRSLTANIYLHAYFGSHLYIRYRTGTLVLRH